MTLVMIAGKARSGKNTTADIIREYCENQGKSVVVIGFADELKVKVADLLGVTLEELEELKSEFKEVRRLLQNYGQVMKKLYGSDYWVKHLSMGVGYAKDIGIDVFIVPDYRFLIESKLVETCPECKSVFIKVEKDGLTGEIYKDISETELDEIAFPYKIKNNGTMEELKEQVLEIVKDIC